MKSKTNTENESMGDAALRNVKGLNLINTKILFKTQNDEHFHCLVVQIDSKKRACLLNVLVFLFKSISFHSVQWFPLCEFRILTIIYCICPHRTYDINIDILFLRFSIKVTVFITTIFSMGSFNFINSKRSKNRRKLYILTSVSVCVIEYYHCTVNRE